MGKKKLVRKRSWLTDTEDKQVVTSGERKEGTGNMGWRSKKDKVLCIRLATRIYFTTWGI